LKPIEIQGRVQQYAWGKPADTSLVARLSDATGPEPYAELWFGAHPSAPSLTSTLSSGSDLLQLIESDSQAILGSRVDSAFSGRLPFLFKILSIGSALSIQAHPTKEQARKLHAADPEHYPDDNHKPEMAIALTETQLLFGLRPFAEVRTWLERVPEFDLLPSLQRDSLRSLVESFYQEDEEVVKQATVALVQRLKQAGTKSAEEQWVLSLAERFPKGDRGLFCFFLLNLVRLQPWQAVFVPAGIPHAYLSGDLLECMANSDNVVRAGLTEKYCDEETLLSIMDFSEQEFTPLETTNSGVFERYPILCEEFSVTVARAQSGRLSFHEKEEVELLFVLDGIARVSGDAVPQELAAGDALLVPAKVEPFQLDLINCALLVVSVP